MYVSCREFEEASVFGPLLIFSNPFIYLLSNPLFVI